MAIPRPKINSGDFQPDEIKKAADSFIEGATATAADLSIISAEKKPKKRGPKPNPAKQNYETMGFRLPTELADLIRRNAVEFTTGNNSQFLIDVLHGKRKLKDL